VLPWPDPVGRGCNSSATAAFRGCLCSGRPTAAVLVAALLLAAPSARAQDAPAHSPSDAAPSARDERPAVSVAKFLAGGALGLAAHESAHVATDLLCGSAPGLRKVTFGPIPFFAITHDRLSPRREFLVASAGFWAQHVSSEILLSSRPRLRNERAPLVKGWLAFNVLASSAYAVAAMAHAGPEERDTRSMAAFLGVNEAAVGGMLLAPAALDTLRYFRPEARWAVWASRAAKIAMVVLVVKKGRSS